MKKNISHLSLLLILLALAGCNTSGAASQSSTVTATQNQPPRGLQAESEDMFTYQFDSELQGIRITQYHGDLTQVKLPDEIAGFPVVAIDESTFLVGHVTDVFFPDTVQLFEWGGINTNDLPYNLVVPYGVTHLNALSFPRSSDRRVDHIRTVDIPPTVRYLGERVFAGFGSLTALTIPQGVAGIPPQAFNETVSLLTIDFPSSVIYVNSRSQIEDTSWWAVQPEGVVYIGSVAYMWKGDMPSNTVVSVREGTVLINPGAFQGRRNLVEITLPSSLIEIGSGAFAGSALTSLEIPDNVVSLGSRAFANSDLTNIVIPYNVIYIGSHAFNGSALTDVVIESVQASIGTNAFVDTALTNISLPYGITRLPSFRGTYLTTIEIPDSVVVIGSHSFYGVPLRHVVLPNSLETIGRSAFENTLLTSIEIPESVTYIGERSFSNTNIDNDIILPRNITQLRFWAFLGTRVTTIYVPAGVDSFHSSADNTVGGHIERNPTTLPSNRTGTAVSGQRDVWRNGFGGIDLVWQ